MQSNIFLSLFGYRLNCFDGCIDVKTI